jgi:tetratricopeptide (TPR) repeat protein
MIHLSRRDIPAAEASFRAALQQDPNNLQAYFELARIYIVGNRLQEAFDQCQALLAQDPDTPSVHMLLGILYEMQAQADMAENHYRKALTSDPSFAPAANNLAYLLTHRNLDEALELARIAKAKLPRDPFVADTLGWIFFQKGLYGNALRELRDSAAKLPDNPEVQYHLGVAYLKLEKNDQAREHLTRALELGGNFNGAEEARIALAGL